MYENYYGFARSPLASRRIRISLSQPVARQRVRPAAVRDPRREALSSLPATSARERPPSAARSSSISIGRRSRAGAESVLTEEDLLKRILQDFGVISREEMKSGRLANVTSRRSSTPSTTFCWAHSAQASAVVIIDEAQNLPLPVLEQIRILSNLETDKEKLLQIILVGQLNLQPLLRSPDMRQLDQRVSIRYELKRSMPMRSPPTWPPVDDRGRIGGRHVYRTGARTGASSVGRHSTSD